MIDDKNSLFRWEYRKITICVSSKKDSIMLWVQLMRRAGEVQDVKESDMGNATRELFSPKGEKTHKRDAVKK